MHYVIGDVHGCFDELQVLLQKIEEMDSEAKYIFLGDFIDRGPKVWETLQWAMKNITSDGKYRSVLGNHEDMAIKWMKEYSKILKHNRTEPDPSYNFDFDQRMEENIYDQKGRYYFLEEDFIPFITFFESLPLTFTEHIHTKWGIDVTYIITHAWHDPKETNPFYIKENNIWERVYTGYWPDTEEILIHGHTPTLIPEYYVCGESCTRPGMISYRHQDVNIDGGCVFFGQNPAFIPCMLCAIRLEDLEEIYPWTLEERLKMSPKYTKKDLKFFQKTFPDISGCRFRKDILKIMGK